jgi:hypothetical protein
MIRYIIAVAFVSGSIMITPSLSEAAQPAQLMVGDPSGRNVAFSFDQGGNGGNAAVRIETHQVGDPGAKLSIWIDHSRSRLFSRILTTDDCKYGDNGAQCRFVIDRESPDYRRFVVAFKLGKTAHIEVENAGAMQMSNDISLVGFARKLGPRS